MFGCIFGHNFILVSDNYHWFEYWYGYKTGREGYGKKYMCTRCGETKII